MKPMSEAPRDGSSFIAKFRDMRGATGCAVVTYYAPWKQITPTLRLHGVVWDMEAIEWIGWMPLPGEVCDGYY